MLSYSVDWLKKGKALQETNEVHCKQPKARTAIAKRGGGSQATNEGNRHCAFVRPAPPNSDLYIVYLQQISIKMQVSFTHPHPMLKPYVEGYYYIALDCSSSDPLDIHPIGYNTIAFTLNPQAVFKPDSGSDYNFNLSYHGYISKYISLIPLQAFIKMIVVSFTTNGASQLFGISQPELINQIIPIEDVISGSGTLKEKLEENMLCERKAISSIERWLLEQLPKKEPSRYAQNIDYACNLIQLRYGNIRITDLCLEVNMSQTNLEDHFKEMIGISPKHYCRIIRFIAAYRFILNNTHIDWGALVHRYNFFDQAHFISDFKTFFGYSPSKIHLANAHLAKGLTLEI